MPIRRSFLAFIPFAMAATAVAEPIDGDLLAGLSARNVGPAGMSGRITDIDVLSSNPNHILAGSATGGVWLSKNGGLNWSPVFNDQPFASIGAVAVDQNNPDIMWVGTGEGNTRNSTSIGGGIFKSVDGGKTWNLLGLEGTERINHIALHPHDPDIAYVAALGTLWGKNEDRGIYKTTDGGKTWDRILYVDETTGGTDIKVDPQNPHKLFAAMWQFERKPYEFTSGGPGSGLYVSHDGGDSWKKLDEADGLPKGNLGRSVFAIAPSDPNRVYALVEAKDSALIRSDDGGHSWQTVNDKTNISVRPFYYTGLEVDPEDPDTLYNVESRVSVSIDGGKSFDYIEAIDCCAPSNTIHIDTHSMWINPNDPQHLIVGNDGGIAISRDKGETWRFVRNLPLAQFYHIAVDDAQPYNIYGGLQDNGSWRGPSEIWQVGGIRNHHWQEVGFGDGFDTVPDPENPRRGYTMSQGGSLLTWDLDTGEQRFIKPNPPSDETDLRFNWDAGFAQDPFDPATIYYGSQFVHKSTDRGLSWQTISADLTTNDPEMQTFRKSGGLTSDVTAAENYTTITVIAPSKLEEGVLWVGTDDGRVHITRDGGASWQSIEDRARGVEDGAWVPFIHPSPHDPSVAFVVFDDHRRSDMKPYVYRVSEYGRRWDRIVDENDAAGYALSFLQDPKDPKLMFLGTELGLYVSIDAGENWNKWSKDVPTVSVMDMAIQEREDDLILGTHGRAVYVIDDFGALRALDENSLSARFKLLDVTDGQQYAALATTESRFPGSGEYRSENEPYGVMLSFIATGDDLPHPDAEKERERKIAQRIESTENGAEDETEDTSSDKKVTITVRDASDMVIRTFKADVQQGINRVIWNMRRDGIPPVPPAKPKEDGTLPAGPEVPPGTYRITLGFDDMEESASVSVLPDPRTPYNLQAMQARYEAEVDLMELSHTMGTSVRRILDARRDIDTLLALAKDASENGSNDNDDAEGPVKEVKDQAKSLKDALDEMEKRFRVPPDTKGIVYSADKVGSRIGTANFFIASTFDAPSPTSQSYIRIAQNSLQDALDDLNALLREDLPALRAAAQEAGLGLLKQEPVTIE